jgi:hypothetical protein
MNQHGHRHHAQHRQARWSRRSRAIAGVGAILLVGTAAVAATNWIVGLSGSSSGQAHSRAIDNLTITAANSPDTGTYLYPGVTGDVVVEITNPNDFPVTVTALDAPVGLPYAGGYETSTLTPPEVTGCTTATSEVTWTGSPGSHALSQAVTVDANDSQVVTLKDAAEMATTSPQECSDVYFKMPSLDGVTATSGDFADVATSPASTSWAS